MTVAAEPGFCLARRVHNAGAMQALAVLERWPRSTKLYAAVLVILTVICVRSSVASHKVLRFQGPPAKPYLRPLESHAPALSTARHDHEERRLSRRNTASFNVSVVKQSKRANTIPRILHQSYLHGRDALYEAALSPDTYSYFRKEWWTSCQIQNSEWKYMFWDSEKAEELLKRRYPWFLPIWRKYKLIVMKSDAIRPFILHTYGGVYLDLDTECYRSMDDSVQGYDLVLPGELPTLVNNAQMASAASHPYWLYVMRQMNRTAKLMSSWKETEKEKVVKATGPVLYTDALKEYLGLHGDNVVVTGNFTAKEKSQVKVYNPGQWFHPCDFVDINCQRAQISNKMLHRHQSALVGMHRFSNTWTLQVYSVNKTKEIMSSTSEGALDLFGSSRHFVECRCGHEKVVGTDPGPKYGVCWDIVQEAVKRDSCVVYSIRETALPGTFEFENQLANAGCKVTLFSPVETPVDVHQAVAHQRVRLGTQEDLSGTVNVHTLKTLLAMGGSSKITLMHIDCGGCEWQVVHNLYWRDSHILARTQMLLMRWGPLPSENFINFMYYHLYQELGFLGYYHSIEINGEPRQSFDKTNIEAQNTILQNLRVGFLLRPQLSSIFNMPKGVS